MNTRPFELTEDRTAITRDGRTVTQVTLFTDTGDPYPVRGVLDGSLHAWTASGSHLLSKTAVPADLFLPALTPPLHNPDNLTPEQVGEGFRLLTVEEREEFAANLMIREIQAWNRLNAIWVHGPAFGSMADATYRIPIANKESIPPASIPERPLAIGDVVILKSGGPEMTVDGVGDDTANGKWVGVSWMLDGKREASTFLSPCLTRIPPQ